jgi:hypothetical protein
MSSSTTANTDGNNNSNSDSTSEKIWYTAVCHCKAVQYKAYLPRKLIVNRCNCSICTKLGYLLVYPTKEEVEWLSGYDNLADYQCGPKNQDHKFCKTCGASVGIDAKGYDTDVDCWRLNVSFFFFNSLVSLFTLVLVLVLVLVWVSCHCFDIMRSNKPGTMLIKFSISPVVEVISTFRFQRPRCRVL